MAFSVDFLTEGLGPEECVWCGSEKKETVPVATKDWVTGDVCWSCLKNAVKNKTRRPKRNDDPPNLFTQDRL